MAGLAIRKSLRISAVVFPVIYYYSNKITTLFIILPFLILFIVLEIIRFYISGFNQRLFGVFGYILKEKEKKGLFTTTLFLVSVFLSIILFKKDIAITAILFLIFGDTASSVIGKYFGRTKIGERSLEGSMAFLITCLSISILLSFTKINLSWPTIIAGAFAATVIELLPLPIDDNFTIALFSGIIMTIMPK